MNADEITWKRLPSGCIRIQGRGPCNWSQAQEGAKDPGFFPEAGEQFRRAAGELWARAPWRDLRGAAESEPWGTCSHEWAQVADSQLLDESREDVRCIRCQCPGERTIATGKVFWPAT